MKVRIRERFLRTDIWLLIAFLALAGWSLDALRMFLEMHGNWQGGLAAFASHFWYAIPMAAAVIILSRLKPKARLLGAATYDEAGRVAQTQGDCCLGELVASGMVAALRDSGPDALQGLTLPSGASAYFVRQGSRTVVLSFSGPAAPEALAAGVRQLTARAPVAFDVFEGLEPAVAALAANALNSPVKRDVLAYLHRFKLSAIELSDLVYRVGASEAAVTQALDDLSRLDLVYHLVVCDLTFYQLNRAPETLHLLDQLFAWQTDWQVQLQKLSSYLLTRPQYARIMEGT
jgi:hypothetical protein